MVEKGLQMLMVNFEVFSGLLERKNTLLVFNGGFLVNLEFLLDKSANTGFNIVGRALSKFETDE